MAFAILSLLFLLFSASSLEAASHGRGGISLDLIQRDSPLSPYYNPSSTHFDRLAAACRRSITRSHRFKPTHTSQKTIQSEVAPISGEYLMKFSMGTPPVEIMAIADTGSDLTWTQCSPCSDCYTQTAPIFYPENSSSYRALSCDARACQSLEDTSCGSESVCQYSVSYGDHSYSRGDLAAETFRFRSTDGGSVVVPNVVYGCGHNNEGTFNETGSGIVGLGGGSVSIVKQLSKSISGKFSYCLVPLTSQSGIGSKINFGAHAVVSGHGVDSTPLVTKKPDTFYYLTLESITVGATNLPYKKAITSDYGDEIQEGNIIIDSGTTLTLLPQSFYEELETQISQVMNLETSTDPEGIFSLCYVTETDIDAPKITFHFTDADVELGPANTFLRVQEDLVCLAMVPSDKLAIFGNLSQMNFLIGYDLENRKVSFKSTDCSKQ